MQHIYTVEDIQLEDSWLTIGSFDGVHLGHQQIIHALVDQAHKNNQPSVVVTFHPHPLLVIKEETRPFYLTLPEKRAQYLAELGVDYVLTFNFSKETSLLSAEAFIRVLHQQFHFSQFWVGHDFALGKNREGTPDRLKELGGLFGYELKEIPPFYVKEELVSSSRIRRSIREGNMREAAEFLGRSFQISGRVISGENRGKSLGFPTLNLEVPKEMVNIKPGVYACQAEVRGKSWKAVTNIGFRPTFGGGIKKPRIEAHLLDFSRDIYGEQVSLDFIDRLRDEMKFDRVSALTAQIQSDIDETLQILEE